MITTHFKKASLSIVLFFTSFAAFAAPVNDDCASATLLSQTSFCSYTSGTNANATQSSFASTCSGTADDDVWYKFVATGTSASITVQGSSDFDAVIQLLTACGGTSLYCSDNSGYSGTEVISASGLINGATYYVRVYHYSPYSSSTNTFNICVSTVATPGNDNCSSATFLSQSVSCNATSASSYGATSSGVSAGCGGNTDDDVWFRFTATSTNTTIKVVGSSGFDAVIQLFYSCGGSSLSCADASLAGGTETLATSGLTEGVTYYIRVYDYYAGSTSNSTFTICLTAPLPSPPANDNCANAISIGGTSCSAVTGTTAGATTSAFASGCAGTANDDVWYKFVANGPDANVSVQGITNFDAVVEVLDGCTGNSLKCSDVTAGQGLESFYLSGLVNGNTYFVRVYDFYSSNNYSNEFSICVALHGPLVNDECNNAILLPVTSSDNNLTSGTTDGASQSTALSCNGNSDDDVWFKFIASSDKDSILVIGGNSFDAVIGVYDACGAIALTCADNSSYGYAENAYLTGLTVGHTYYVRVYHYYSGSGSTPLFAISVYNGSIITSMNGSYATNKLALYPNPATSELHMDLSAHKNEVMIEFFDVQGKLVKKETAISGNNVVISLDQLLGGIYTVRVLSDGLSSTGKVVVVK
ncbi:MAG: T9SS type A sorting domain-containing protein [Cytophagaceae bacterium]|nr:T9SS type A sorting domain-containing protein [Cytophagaceae bacterium]